MMPAFLIKWGADIVIGLLAIVFVGWALQTFVFGPMNAKHDLAAANGQAAINTGGQKSAADAIKTAYEDGVKAGKTDAQTRANYIYITKQPGASDPVNPALFDALVRSVCLRVSAASLPECHGLQQLGP